MKTIDHILKSLALVCMVFGLVLLGQIVTGKNNLLSRPNTKAKATPVNTTSVIKFPVHYPNFRCDTDGTNIFVFLYLSETNCVTNRMELKGL